MKFSFVTTPRALTIGGAIAAIILATYLMYLGFRVGTHPTAEWLGQKGAVVGAALAVVVLLYCVRIEVQSLGVSPALAQAYDAAVRTARDRWDMSVLRAGQGAGAQTDQRAEAEIQAAGLTAPRVTAEQIQALMATLTWKYEQPGGTTSTFAHAFLGRFYLATGHSACVSPENFDAALGMKYAREQAEGKARDKIWELEGYALFKQMGRG